MKHPRWRRWNKKPAALSPTVVARPRGATGPGEVLGIEGIIGEVQTALTKLQRFRRQSRESLLLQKPTLIKKGGFLSWLHR